MTDENMKNIFQIIIDNLENKEFIWRIEWSANLKLQGIDNPIKDIDITTNDEWIDIFRQALKDFIIESWFREKTKWLWLICNINWFEVEINSYWDRRKNFFDKTEKIVRQWLEIPVLPLEYAKVFYEIIGRKDKVKLISDYLSK